MEINFPKLIALILNDDKEALQKLLFSADEIVKTWCRREKQETKWIATGGKPVTLRHITCYIVEDFCKHQEQKDIHLNTFSLFKDHLIRELKSVLKSRFAEFMNLLKDKENKAWQIVCNDLQNRASSWFFKRNLKEPEINYSLFCESLEVLYIKLMNNQLYFPDSPAFKSYFFKILENKYHELSKDNYRRRALSIDDMIATPLFDSEYEDEMEKRELQLMVKNAFGKLNQDEQEILTEYFYEDKKLKDIAAERNQTEENVRIKKFRALKKLFEQLKDNVYGS
ncbi:MAG: sigma-70 family RNA polymerase sigma factor [Bacteroidales bacterium]